MKQTKIIMGMPITIEIAGRASTKDLSDIFRYFNKIDARFSTYKEDSEISKINRGLSKNCWSQELKLVLGLCEQTRFQTGGYFNIEHDGLLDPSGLVKGWAINNAAKALAKKGYQNFYIEAGGDIQTSGLNVDGEAWAVGIRNPFNIKEIIKIIKVSGQGVATSGTYIRGEHIYNPLGPRQTISQLKSFTIVGPDIYEADRFATAAMAMGIKGLAFIEGLPGLEAYAVSGEGIATLTSGFEAYVDNIS